MPIFHSNEIVMVIKPFQMVVAIIACRGGEKHNYFCTKIIYDDRLQMRQNGDDQIHSIKMPFKPNMTLNFQFNGN